MNIENIDTGMKNMNMITLPPNNNNYKYSGNGYSDRSK
jgi:hypothetical protein